MGVSGAGKTTVGYPSPGRSVGLSWTPTTFTTDASRRAGHHLKAGLLESRFGALERPADVLVVNVDRPFWGVVACIRGELHLTAAQETQETL